MQSLGKWFQEGDDTIMALQNLDRMNASLRVGNFARKYNYTISFSPPRGWSTGYTYPKQHLPGSADAEGMLMRCESFAFPGQNISTSTDDIRIGPARQHAIGVTYGPISATFLSTKNFWERTYFTEWHNIMFEAATPGEMGFRMGYYKDYVTDLDITQYDDMGNPTYMVTLVDAFPKGIVQQDLAIADGKFHRLSVEFGYHHWFEEVGLGEKERQVERKSSVATGKDLNIAQRRMLQEGGQRLSNAHSDVAGHVQHGQQGAGYIEPKPFNPDAVEGASGGARQNRGRGRAGVLKSTAHEDVARHVANASPINVGAHDEVKEHVADGGILISQYNSEAAQHVEPALSKGKGPPAIKKSGGPS